MTKKTTTARTARSSHTAHREPEPDETPDHPGPNPDDIHETDLIEPEHAPDADAVPAPAPRTGTDAKQPSGADEILRRHGMTGEGL